MIAVTLSTSTFGMLIVAVVIAASFAFILGTHLSYHRGYGDGLADAEAALDDLEDDDNDQSDDIAQVRWELTATGRQAIAAAVMENSNRREAATP